MHTPIAVITGATSGIGYEIAKILAERKYNLLLVSRKPETLAATQQELVDTYGVAVDVFVQDLSESGAGKRVYGYIAEKGYTIEVLINNAGFGLQGEHLDMPLEKIHSMIQLNITALTDLAYYIGAHMKAQQRGYILNVASTAGYQPLPYMAAYGATKSYVLNFSEALAKELEEYGVSVTALSPGMTATKFFAEMGVGNNTSGVFNKSGRMSAAAVAKIGVDALFAGKISVISGWKNKVLLFLNRISPRASVASITKKMMRRS